MRLARPVMGAIVFGFAAATVAVAQESKSLERNDDPVVVLGEDLQDLLGTPTETIFVFTWNSGTGAFEQIPFQIDKKTDLFLGPPNPGGFPPGPGTTKDRQIERTYDFDGVEDGRGLGPDDELVFMASDTGDRAPAGAEIPGSGAIRWELEVLDPLSSPAAAAIDPFRDEIGTAGVADALDAAHRATRTTAERAWVYVTTSESLERAFTARHYVEYDRTQIDDVFEDTTIDTDVYNIRWSSRWILDDMTIKPGRGSGTNVLDRLKFRVLGVTEGFPLGIETEDVTRPGTNDICGFSDGSSLVGELVGPVRAIRENRGPCSAVNGTQIYRYYRTQVHMTSNLRVHSVPPGGIWFYSDFLSSATPMTYYNDENLTGFIVDGEPDNLNRTIDGSSEFPTLMDLPGTSTATDPVPPLNAFDQFTSDTHGTFVTHIRHERPLAAPIFRYYVDDATFDDGTGDEPGAYGNAGQHWLWNFNQDDPRTFPKQQIHFFFLEKGLGPEAGQNASLRANLPILVSNVERQ